MTKCKVCNHPDRVDIDKALVSGRPLRLIAEQYGVSRSSLSRHQKAGHVIEQVSKAQKAKEIADADTLIDQIRNLQGRANDVLSQAEAGGDLRGACAAIREIRSILELMAKVTGELQGRDNITVNIIENPQFIEFKQIVLEVMCPECREQLRDKLTQINGE